MIRQLFFDHPTSVGETYAQHFRVATRFGWRLTRGGLGCMVHGLLPFAFKSSGSDTVRDLHAELVAKRSAARAAQTQMTTVEYVI
jgi:hypothetical protein